MGNEKEWYTLDELASLFGVPYSRVRTAVQVLSKAGQISTRDKPGDNRVLEIHKDSIELVRRASV
jgi:DNA-binding MarR family transcriptional regulator